MGCHRISGAQNLSGCSKFPPGHWALGLQKLDRLQFKFRAWVSEPCFLGGGRRAGRCPAPTKN